MSVNGYPNVTTEGGPVVVTRDGAPVSGILASADDAFAWLLRNQGQSVSHALTHEGYAIVPAPADGPDDGPGAEGGPAEDAPRPTLTERITADGITSDAIETPEHAPVSFARGTRTYNVTLSYGARRMRVRFHMGPALTREPTTADVLSSLLSDASGVENARDLAEWAREYGYDVDSRTRALYAACVSQTRQLRRLLGESFDTYLWQTDED